MKGIHFCLLLIYMRTERGVTLIMSCRRVSRTIVSVLQLTRCKMEDSHSSISAFRRTLYANAHAPVILVNGSLIQNCTWQRHSLAPLFLAEKLLNIRQAIAVVVFSAQPLTIVHRAACALITRRSKHGKFVPQMGQFVIVIIACRVGDSF